MKRYAVTNHSTGMTHEVFDTLPEALCSAIRFQDSGGRPALIDSQGSGRIVVELFDLEAVENTLGRTLRIAQVDHPVSVEDVLNAARQTAPKKGIITTGTPAIPAVEVSFAKSCEDCHERCSQLSPGMPLATPVFWCSGPQFPGSTAAKIIDREHPVTPPI